MVCWYFELLGKSAASGLEGWGLLQLRIDGGKMR
jgi:hypothetical protein